MKLKNKLVLGLSFITLTLNSYAQNDKTIVIVDKNDTKKQKEYTYPNRALIENTSVLKFSPLQLSVGEINFGWERKIDNIKSIELEFGPTLSKIGFTVNNNNNLYSYDSIPSPKESSKLGFFGSVGMRFYPLEKGLVLNNFYVSPVLKYRVKNICYSDASSILPDRTGSEIDFNFSFNFGYQKWLTQNFSLDFFGGMGLAQESYRKFKTEYTGQPDPNTGYYYNWKLNSYSGVRFLLTAGIKVGIGH
jgi:hypothetical protein